MSTQQDRAEALWREALGINRCFLRLRPLYPVAHKLALNAEVSSARLGRDGRALNVVMREVGGVTDMLSALVEAVEAEFAELVRLVARWIRLDSQLQLYTRAVDQSRARRGLPPARWPSPLAPDAPAQWQALAADAPAGERALWAVLRARRSELLGLLAEVQGIIRALDRHVEQVSWVATRKTRYITTIVCVETSRLSDGSVAGLSGRMRDLSERIAEVEEQARRQVDRLVALSHALSPPPSR